MNSPLVELFQHSDKPFEVQPVANGFLVRGGYEFQRNGPSTLPCEWRVFETFDGMVAYLRATYVRSTYEPPKAAP